MSKETNILFLDDEENILNSFKRLFMNSSFNVATTTDPDEALSIIESENIKVVFSDHRMPKITGVEFLKKVKERFPDKIRILFTGYADINAAEEAINVGEVYRFISKPWEVNELKTNVTQAMEHYDLIEENKRLLSETQKNNEELEESNLKLLAMYEVQKKFTSTVSHELRTPLASIKMGLDIVLSGTAGDLNDEQKKFLNKSKDNIDRLNRLINEILDISKLQSKDVKLDIKENDISKAILDVIEAQKGVAQNKNLELKAAIDDNPPLINFDSDKIIQVLNNFINNAIKFIEEGSITVRCLVKTDANHLEIRVEDTGPGIKQEDLSKVFEVFQQLGDATQQVGGSGLGLAICREIIAKHKGKIWAESEVGKGSAFCFILPIKERRSR